jgi:membrane-bound lytic murein transglycosylase F
MQRPIDNYSNEFDEHFKKYSALNFGENFDYRWFKAMAVVESTLNARAVSKSGAKGLMQIMPNTFTSIRKHINVSGTAFDPETNIAAGIWYSKYLFNTWSSPRPIEDRIAFMLASYNAGVRTILERQKVCSKETEVRLWTEVRDINAGYSRYVDKIFKLMSCSYT